MNEGQYPIRAIAELTGVPATTLRAWERRYGLLNPNRSAKGHRLYQSEDIELVKQIVVLLKNNHTISEAIKILRNPQQQESVIHNSENHWLIYQQRLLKAIENFNEQRLDSAYNEALSIYPINLVTEHVIIPVLDNLGKEWKNRETGIAEEHFFSVFLRNKLGARLHHHANRSQSNKFRGNKILVSCLPGEYHELGILLYSITAMSHGYQVLYLGASMPPEQLPAVVRKTGVAAIVFSVTSLAQWEQELHHQLQNCINALAIPVMFGGLGTERFAQEIQQLGANNIGANQITALEKMESIIPAFNPRQ